MPESLLPFHPSHHLHYHTGTNLSLFTSQFVRYTPNSTEERDHDQDTITTFSGATKKKRQQHQQQHQQQQQKLKLNQNLDIVDLINFSVSHSLRRTKRCIMDGGSRVLRSATRFNPNRTNAHHSDKHDDHDDDDDDKLWVQTLSFMVLSLLVLLVISSTQGNKYSHLNLEYIKDNNGTQKSYWGYIAEYQLEKLMTFGKSIAFVPWRHYFDQRWGFGVTTRVVPTNVFGEFDGNLDSRFPQFDPVSLVVVCVFTLLFSVMLS